MEKFILVFGKCLVISFMLFLLCLITPSKPYASADINPDENNLFGIHILFPEEIETAAKLVNSRMVNER